MFIGSLYNFICEHDTSSDDATTSSSKSGCNGSVGAGMLGILGLGVDFVAIKKKKD